jgi:ribonucleoside-diphosphate reductase alpha chain
MRYMLATQMAAPNSPQWFNTGLHWAYGIDGPAQGHHYVDYKTGKLTKSNPPTSIRSPMPASSSRSRTIWSTTAASWTCGCARRACSNTAPAPAPTSRSCAARAKKLSGGGKSSGLMGFLKIGDRAAGAIKSGGTTRRAAKMVICDADHPDIEDFINWKVIEEQKVASIVAGSKMHEQKLNAHLRGDPRMGRRRADAYDPEEEQPALKAADPRCRQEGRDPRNLHQARAGLRPPGLHRIEFPTYDTDWDSEAYLGLGPELQQLHPRHRCLPQGGRRTTPTGS